MNFLLAKENTVFLFNESEVGTGFNFTIISSKKGSFTLQLLNEDAITGDCFFL